MPDTMLPIAEIRINGRHRRDMGDIPSLAASIAHLGLLQSLVVDSNFTLICGERRLEAIKSLGWSEVPIRVVAGLDDALKALEAERDENTERKDFTPSEKVALGQRIEEVARKEAKERQRAGAARAGRERAGKKNPRGKAGGRRRSTGTRSGGNGQGEEEASDPESSVGGNGHISAGGGEIGSGNFPEPISNQEGELSEAKGQQARDQVGIAVGLSGKSYEKAKAVIDAAEADPEKYGKIREEMDRTEKIDAAFKKLKAMQKAEQDAAKSEEERERERIRRGYEQWEKMVKDVLDYFIGLNSRGGIGLVAKKWSGDVKRGYRDYLRETGDRFHGLADELEGMIR